MKQFLFVFLIVPFFSLAQHTLIIEAKGLKSSDGLIAVGVYNTADSFLKEGEAFAGNFKSTTEGITKISIPDLPSGTYAVSIFHDENGNKKLDTNFIGIPKESVAFSKAKMKTFGPPDFEECSFVVNSDLEIVIPIK